MVCLSRLFVAGTVGVFVLAASSQARRLPSRHFNTADGLPQSQVLALQQDRLGELWIGTWSGVARYDGATFRNLTSRHGLPSNFILDIAEDGDGNLWLAAGGAIARIAADDRSRAAEVFEPPFPGAGENWIRDLFIDRRGTLWAAGQHGGIAAYGPDRPDDLVTLDSPPLAADVLRIFAQLADGTVLVGTEAGVHTVTGGAVRPWRQAPGPWQQAVTLLYTTPEDSLILGTEEGLWRLDGDRPRALRDSGAAITEAISALVDGRGRLWIGNRQRLFVTDASGVLHPLDESSRLGEGRRYDLLEDHEGNVWLGTDSGLTLSPGDLFELFLLPAELASRDVWSLALGRDGEPLIGTASGLVSFRGGRFEPWPGAYPLRDRVVRAIVDDGHGGYWFGTLNHGVSHWDGARWRSFAPPDFPAERVYGAYVDRRGDAWFATRRGAVRHRDGVFTAWGQEQGLPADQVWKIEEDPEGRVVVATSRGLARLEGERFTVPPRFEPLFGKTVIAFTFRRDGSLWVGTYGDGLQVHRDGAWHALSAADSADGPAAGHRGPANDFAWGLLEDRGGRLWLATNRGFSVSDGTRWLQISQRDGLIEAEIAANAGLADHDGSVWFGFGGGGGLVRFPPQLPQLPAAPPAVRITGVEAGGRTLDATLDYRLPWRDRDVTFSYIANAFREASSILYRTRLEGYDPAFGAATAQRSVRYTNLGPGDYHFLVEAAGTDGRWSARPATVHLAILPPFWLTGWFRLLAIALAAAAVWGLLTLRTWRIGRENRRLEQRVQERTAALQASKRRAENALARVKTLSGLLPICASCKKVRDDQGYWRQIELYLHEHADAEFSHGLCPECVEDIYPEVDSKAPERGERATVRTS